MTDRPAPPQVGQVLTEIAADMERDIHAFEGQPFNGKTVQTQFGNHAAAIAALANIVRDWEGEITALEARVAALTERVEKLEAKENMNAGTIHQHGRDMLDLAERVVELERLAASFRRHMSVVTEEEIRAWVSDASRLTGRVEKIETMHDKLMRRTGTVFAEFAERVKELEQNDRRQDEAISLLTTIVDLDRIRGSAPGSARNLDSASVPDDSATSIKPPDPPADLSASSSSVGSPTSTAEERFPKCYTVLFDGSIVFAAFRPDIASHVRALIDWVPFTPPAPEQVTWHCPKCGPESDCGAPEQAKENRNEQGEPDANNDGSGLGESLHVSPTDQRSGSDVRRDSGAGEASRNEDRQFRSGEPGAQSRPDEDRGSGDVGKRGHRTERTNETIAPPTAEERCARGVTVESEHPCGEGPDHVIHANGFANDGHPFTPPAPEQAKENRNDGRSGADREAQRTDAHSPTAMGGDEISEASDHRAGATPASSLTSASAAQKESFQLKHGNCTAPGCYDRFHDKRCPLYQPAAPKQEPRWWMHDTGSGFVGVIEHTPEVKAALAGKCDVGLHGTALSVVLAKAAADRAELEQLREAIGLLTTLVPSMVMEANDPVGMAKRIYEQADRDRAETERLRKTVQETQERAEWALTDLKYKAPEQLTQFYVSTLIRHVAPLRGPERGE